MSGTPLTEARAIDENRPPPPPDETVLRAQSGDFGAFEELYRRTVGRVYAICLRMTGDRTRAEDLTQEAFTRAWQKLDSFRGEAAFAGWLSRVAVNVVLADRRSRLGGPARESRLDEVLDYGIAGRPFNPAAGLDLEMAIAALPEGARTVFVLHDVEGYRHEEISRLMGVAVGTSKAQLHRARKLLVEALRTS